MALASTRLGIAREFFLADRRHVVFFLHYIALMRNAVFFALRRI